MSLFIFCHRIMSSKVDSMLAIAYTVLAHPKNTYFWNINQISSLANVIIFLKYNYVCHIQK